jgi:hypothetical protein
VIGIWDEKIPEALAGFAQEASDYSNPVVEQRRGSGSVDVGCNDGTIDTGFTPLLETVFPGIGV